jgi:hypothetical protein
MILMERQARMPVAPQSGMPVPPNASAEADQSQSNALQFIARSTNRALASAHDAFASFRSFNHSAHRWGQVATSPPLTPRP